MKKNNTHTTLETLLTPRTEVSLRDDERSAMKAELLAYTVLHQPASPSVPVRLSYSHRFWWQWGSLVAAVVLVVSGAGVAADQSLPGQPLYGIKVSVLEPIVVTLQHPDATTYERSNVFLQRRLDEVKLLQADAEITPQAVADVHHALATYAETVTDVFEDRTGNGVESTPSLNDIDETFAYFEAHDQLLSPTSTNGVTDTIVSKLGVVYDEYVDQLIKEGATSTITTYIDDGITELTQALDIANFAATTSADQTLETVLGDVARELDADSLAGAQSEIADALQKARADEYVEAEVVSEDINIE